MIYKFNLPIGDWSGDGHGEAIYYNIKSNKPLQEVRELYFKACKQLGYTLDGHDNKTPCAEYKDNTFSKEVLKDLLHMGVEIDSDTYSYIIDEETIEPDIFVKIILEFIKTQDKTLKLELVENFDDMFQFYGLDKEKRHIGYFGYGLFN